jgi:hypothetical protein
MGKSAHDLKSISGLIGMQRTSQIAATVEQACITGEHGRLAEMVANLEHVKQSEAIDAHRLAEEGLEPAKPQKAEKPAERLPEKTPETPPEKTEPADKTDTTGKDDKTGQSEETSRFIAKH